MMHVRLFDSSIVSLSLAGGVALGALPLAQGAMLGASMAFAAMSFLAMRDRIAGPPARPARSALAPFEGVREYTREPDATPAPANGNLTPWQAGRSDFRLAPVTDHVFVKGDTVEFIFDSWEEGEKLFRGVIVDSAPRACTVMVGDEPFHVDWECLLLVEAAQ